jgi:tetratricopeptide (TPR) repeat protein
LAVSQELVRLHPQVPTYEFHLAQVYQNMANLYRAMNRSADAEAAFEKAVAVGEPLARAHPEVPEYRGNLGMTYNNQGQFYWRANQYAKAEVAPGVKLGEFDVWEAEHSWGDE